MPILLKPRPGGRRQDSIGRRYAPAVLPLALDAAQAAMAAFFPLPRPLVHRLIAGVALATAGLPGPGRVYAEQPPLAPPAEEVAPGPPAAANPAPRRREIFRPITEVTADATLPEGLLPEQVPEEESRRDEADEMPEVSDPRLFAGWGDHYFEWSATRLCHRPLYFEEVNLERYGYQCHGAVQPLVSGAHFFLTVPTLPYQMTVHPPRECIYTLGHYRPGSRVPWQRHRLPWDPCAAAVQAGVTTGLVFLIP